MFMGLIGGLFLTPYLLNFIDGLIVVNGGWIEKFDSGLMYNAFWSYLYIYTWQINIGVG